jgi:hypothetical protein
MCFNKEMTLGFTVLAAIIGAWILRGTGIWNIDRWRRVKIASCFFWFSFMELIQFCQYLVIDECNNPVNQVWTALGWFHICFQPLFSNLAFSALDPKNIKGERKETWTFISKYCLLSGVLMSSRLILALFFPSDNSFFRDCAEGSEGVCGSHTCSTSGIRHISWTFKMIRPNYLFPGIAVHFLNMFAVPLLMGLPWGSVALFVSGPVIAGLFHGVSAGEGASIWCFFSIFEAVFTVMTQYLAMKRSAKGAEKKKDL